MGRFQLLRGVVLKIISRWKSTRAGSTIHLERREVIDWDGVTEDFQLEPLSVFFFLIRNGGKKRFSSVPNCVCMLSWWSLGLTHAVTPYGWVRRFASTIYGLYSPHGQVSSVQPNEGNNYFLDEEGSSVPSSMTRVPPCRHHSVEILTCIFTNCNPCSRNSRTANPWFDSAWLQMK